MKKMMCSRCGKRPAMFFITKVEGNETKQEGLCMKCAMEMNIGPIKQIMESMGISEDEVDSVSAQFDELFGEDGTGFMPGGAGTLPFMNQSEQDDDEEDEDSDGEDEIDEGDNEDLHFADTVKGSDWGCDQQVARMFVQTAPKAIRELASWGVPWTRITKGDRQAVINAEKTTITEKEEVHGLIHSRDFGGTKKWRTCFTADATGHTMLFGVANEALKRNVEIHDRKEAIALIHENGRCYGAVVRDLITGELAAYVAKGTLIATGGYGRVYKHTTNAVICEGTGAALLSQAASGLRFVPRAQFPFAECSS